LERDKTSEPGWSEFYAASRLDRMTVSAAKSVVR
jgi:hypothetical protein